MIGETDDCAEAADLVDRVFNGCTCVLVEDGEDLAEGLLSGVRLGPAGEMFGDQIHEVDVTIGIAGDDRISDAADGRVQPLLPSVQLLAAQLDLLNLPVVGGGQLVEDSARLQCEHGCDHSDEEDESDPGILVDFYVGRGVFDTASVDDT